MYSSYVIFSNRVFEKLFRIFRSKALKNKQFIYYKTLYIFNKLDIINYKESEQFS